MAKAKSSASSSTRKKHERKAAKALANGDEPPPLPSQPAQRGQKKKDKKKSRFEPKVKSYVPPPPPPKGLPDPVDLYLAGGSTVDPELAVILRRLGKKDEATVGKGVEGLEEWVRETVKQEKREGTDGAEDEWKREQRREQLVESMQVWAHHLPRLALHPSRRLRLSSHQLHTLLTTSPSTSSRSSAVLGACRSALLLPQWTEQREYVGAWAMGPWDGDRAVRSAAKRSWEAVLLPADTESEGDEGLRLKDHAEDIFAFAISHILAAAPTVSAATPAAQADAEQSSSADLAALRTQSLLTLSHLLSPDVLPNPLPLSEESLGFLVSPKLWDLADPSASPAALRRALYDLLGTVAARQETFLEVEDGVKTVAGRVLRYCWAEDEGWAGVIAFLRRYPQAWEMADEPIQHARGEDEDEESDSDDDEDDDEASDDDDTTPSTPAPESSAPSSSAFTPSPTLQLLFQHLTLACTSLPSNYPTILLLLSTLPSSVLPPTTDALNLLFESFWAALEGRALNSGQPTQGTRSATEEWATSLLECLVWEVNKVEDGAEAQDLLREWIGRFVKTFLGTNESTAKSKTGRGVATQLVAQQLAATFVKLAGSKRGDADFRASWEPFKKEAEAILASPSVFASSLTPLALALSALVGAGSEKEHAATVSSESKDLAVQSLKSAATSLQQQSEEIEALLKFVMAVCVSVESEREVLETLDALALARLSPLLASSSPAHASLALAFLTTYLPTTPARSAIWSTLFAPNPPSASTLLQLVKAVQEGQIAVEGLPSAGVEGWVEEVAERVLSGSDAEWSEDEVQVLERVMLQPEPFVPSTLPSQLLERLAALLPALATSAIAATLPSPSLLQSLNPPTRLLANFLLLPSSLSSVRASPKLALAAFEIGHILPSCRLEDERELPVEAILNAQEAWARLSAGEEGKEVVEKAVSKCQEGVVSVDVRASPIELVSICSALLSSTASDLPLASLLPSPATYTALLQQLTILPPSASLSVLSPLIPLSTEDAPVTYAALVDAAALPSYARSLLALLEVAARADHAWIRQSSNLWALEHLLLLADVSRDELASAGSTRGFFGRGLSAEVLARLVGAADGLATYLVSSVANSLPEGWHSSAVQVLRAKEPSDSKDELVTVMDGLARKARKSEEIYARRAFGSLLSSVMRYAEGTQDAVRWLAWAQSLGEGASDLACAIILAVKPLLLETPRYERYQNELAAQLAGVPSSSASTKGLPLLRLLLATAPPLDAPIIFLPQQRTMFLIQAIQKWIGSDDDLDEEILASVAELFLHLAPIVQELSGSHWELIFDVVESNLETASWDEPITLPALYHSCRLLNLVKELASANSELKATARARIDKSLELVRDLFVSRPDSRARNQPRVVILEIMARLVRDLPPKLLEIGSSFNSLLHLLRDPSLAVQQSSYDLIVRIAEKHVSDLVVEVELETENPPAIALPQELVDLLSARLSSDVLSKPEEYSAASTYLLAWLVAFRFFETASPRIKSAYIDQLRRADLVPSSFLPSLFAILNLSDRTRVIDISPWAVSEFQLELVEELTSTILPVFATFIYYRALQAVPSLIREWWERCKNRQLSIAVSNFTSKHFSPVLIAAELAHLRDPNDPAGRQLRDNEDFTVKVAQGANEVKATFVVDEETMEIVVKLPAEFPLAQVEVKDVRKIGVKDSQWRAWLLAIQQVIANQNGLIADALNVFKRNIVAHFDGVESCGICMAVVNAVDRTLPTKPCGTCSARYHPSCLLKWFNTSHGSSCPLCRSLF